MMLLPGTIKLLNTDSLSTKVKHNIQVNCHLISGDYCDLSGSKLIANGINFYNKDGFKNTIK